MVNYTVLVNAAIIKNGEMLIIQRSDREKHQAGKWCLPGGKLEETEEVIDSLEKTAKREIKEETGINIEPLSVIYNNTFKHSEDNQLTLAIIFLCIWKSGEAKPLDDTQNVKWIKEDEINNYHFPPNVKDYIKTGFGAYRVWNK